MAGGAATGWPAAREVAVSSDVADATAEAPQTISFEGRGNAMLLSDIVPVSRN